MALALLAVVLLGTVGCGLKSDPLPPIRLIPSTTDDLSIHQQGRELIFRLGYPQTTTSGFALPGLDALEVFELTATIDPDGDEPQLDPRAFVEGAESILSISGPELLAAIRGDRIETRFPLQDPLPTGDSLFAFAVRTVSATGEISDLSNIVQLVLRPPAEPPQGFEAQAQGGGVALSWEAVRDSEGFNVYRRPATVRSYGDPLRSVAGDRDSFVDRTARFGERYIYTVRTITNRDPLVESSPAVEQEVDYEDRFPPRPPENLVALGETERVRLLWEASPSADAVGYHLYRQDLDGGEFRRISDEPLTDLEYLDTGLGSGREYRYRATAIDNVGNEGQPTRIISVQVQ